MDEKTLEQLAVDELMKEAKRGRERYKTMGPSGWQKNLVPRANKQFLQRTLASSLHSSARHASMPRKHKTNDDKSATNERNKMLKLDKNVGSSSDSKIKKKNKAAKEKHVDHNAVSKSSSSSKSSSKRKASAT